jgi:hypothetical protein
MSHQPDRRTDHLLRARIEKLLGRVHDARQEIVERGLTAAHRADPRIAPHDAVRGRAGGRDRRHC